MRVFDTTRWSELPGESWQAHSGAVSALAISNDTHLLATSGDTTLKLWLTEKTRERRPSRRPLAESDRVEMLSFSTYFPAAWLHFGRDADGSDRSAPARPALLPAGNLARLPRPGHRDAAGQNESGESPAGTLIPAFSEKISPAA